MIVHVVTMPVQPDRKDEFIAFIKPLVEASREEAGVNLYNYHWKADDANAFVLVEEYASQEALDAHGEEAHTKKLLAEMPEYLTGPLELRRYDVSRRDIQSVG